MSKATELEKTEIYEKERVASEFFSQLRDRHGTTHETVINNAFGAECLRKTVLDVPVFAKVSA